MKQSPQATVQRRDKIAALVAGRPLAEGLPLKAIAAELDIGVEGVRHLIKSMLGGQRVALGKLPKEHGHRAYDPSAADHFRDATKMVEPVTPAEPIGAPESELCPAQPLEPLEPADLSTLADFLSAAADALGEMEPADDIDITAAAADAPAAKPCGACADGCQGTQCRLMQDSPPIHTDRINFALWDDGGLSIYDGDELLQLPPADTARLARLLGVPGCQLASGVAA